MRFLAGHLDLQPALALGAGDDTDRQVGRLQDRALLDMRLEIGGHRVVTRRLLAGIPDGFQVLTENAAVIGGLGEHLVEAENPGEHARAHHRRRIARTFLIGPHRHLNRRRRFNPGVIQRAHHFQGAKHAVDAIETAAGRLGVQMAARHHRQAARVAARPARENIADLVDRHRAAGVLGPFDEQVTALAVQLGTGQTRHAALRRGPDLGHFH